MCEGLDRFLEHFFAESIADEYAFTKTQWIPLVMERLDVHRRVYAHHRQPHGVRTGVNRGDMDRIRHEWYLTPEMRECGGRRVLHCADAELFGDSLPQQFVNR